MRGEVGSLFNYSWLWEDDVRNIIKDKCVCNGILCVCVYICKNIVTAVA